MSTTPLADAEKRIAELEAQVAKLKLEKGKIKESHDRDGKALFFAREALKDALAWIEDTEDEPEIAKDFADRCRAKAKM